MKLAKLEFAVKGVLLEMKLKDAPNIFLARFEGIESGWLYYSFDGIELASPAMAIEWVEIVDVQIEQRIKAFPVGVLPEA